MTAKELAQLRADLELLADALTTPSNHKQPQQED